MTYPKAQEVVRRAYLAVLKREPDPASRGYVDRVLRDKWTQADVERELRQSPEYPQPAALTRRRPGTRWSCTASEGRRFDRRTRAGGGSSQYRAMVVRSH